MNNKYRLILVRHGETNLNKAGCYQGLIDVELSENGIEQARKIGSVLHNSSFKVDKINTSCLKRAIKTGSYIIDNDTTKQYLELNEMDFGQWEGKLSNEVKQLYPEDLNKWNQRDVESEIGPTNGETFKKIGDRIENFLNNVKYEVNIDSSVVMVTHVYVIKSILDRVMNLPDGYHANRLWLDTGSITIVDWSSDPNKRIIHRINWTPEIDSGSQKWSKM